LALPNQCCFNIQKRNEKDDQILMITVLTACIHSSDNKVSMNYSQKDFASEINGKRTDLYILTNKQGMTVTLTNYGAKIVSIFVPDRNGKMADVVLGFGSIADYIKYGASHGATVGPYANRISGANFMIDSIVYNLQKNSGENCIHSGKESFYRQVWDASQTGNAVEMTLQSPDGEWGFPGNKKVRVVFTLTEDNELRIDYSATTDKATHFNLTNHSYFNLRGEGNGDILSHMAVINSTKVTRVDSFMIPTGDIVNIQGSPLDFMTPHTFGERIDADDQQLKIAKGYDFNYIIDKPSGELAFAASVSEPESGRHLEVFTTEPAVQLYTGNNLRGNEIGKSYIPYNSRSGFCLETQHFPDTPHRPEFPATLLIPGDTLSSITIFKFSVKK
jgi:aldose 1-epimerase